MDKSCDLAGCEHTGPTETCTLNQLGAGCRGCVVSVGGERELRRRLLEMGFCNGAHVEVIRRAPLGDPIEFRLKNAAKEGTRRVDGPVYPRVGLVETLDAIKNSEHYRTPLKGPRQGRGVASGFWFNCGLKSSASATVTPVSFV